MRILILGAGATGGYFGGLLVKAGVDVTFLVRPKRREQLVRDGLKIESPQGNIATPVNAITRDELAAPFDVVILSSKAYGLAGAIETIRPAVGESTLVLPLLNGLRHLDDLDAAFGPSRVLGGTCHISVVLGEDGTIRHLSPFASLTQGPRTDKQKDGSARLHKELVRGGFEARHSDDIIGAMWEKWVLLATLAGSTCLMRSSIGEIVRADTGSQFISNMLDECCAVAKVSGHPPHDSCRSRCAHDAHGPAVEHLSVDAPRHPAWRRDRGRPYRRRPHSPWGGAWRADAIAADRLHTSAGISEPH